MRDFSENAHLRKLQKWRKITTKLSKQRVCETRTATPARTSSDIMQSKYCFRTLPLVYHPKDRNEASCNSDMPENHIFFFERESFKKIALPLEA